MLLKYFLHPDVPYLQAIAILQARNRIPFQILPPQLLRLKWYKKSVAVPEIFLTFKNPPIR